MKYRELTPGQRFGNWTVIGPDNATTRHDPHKHWLCRCACGNIVSVSGSRLRRGTSVSCGCHLRVEEIGNVYGRLTVIAFHSNPRQWLCRCSCGREIIAYMGGLRSGSTQSCGCYRREVPRIRGRQHRTRETLLRVYAYRTRKSAETRGYRWALTKDDVKRLAFGLCYYCGTPPRMHVPNYPEAEFCVNGIDRQANGLGYTRKNCVSCCPVCNRMKLTLTAAMFLEHVRKIAAHSGFTQRGARPSA